MKIPALESLKYIPGSLMIDGTLISVWNWASQGRTLFSGKHKRTGYNYQVICTLSGKLLAFTDPVPGARPDVYTYRFHQLERFLDEPILADKGYIGLVLLTPTKRKVGVRMRAAVKEDNRRINRLRPLGSYARVFSVVRAFIFFSAETSYD